MSTSRATHLSGLVCGPVTLDSATVTLTEALHAGRPLVMDRAAGITATLPEATGSGATYEFLVATTATGDHIVQAADATDWMNGVAHVANDTDNSASLFETANSGTPATETDTVTLNGTTTGGYVGAVVRVVDVKANQWNVFVSTAASGTEATPFSAAV